MLTILHDRDGLDGKGEEIAFAEGLEVRAPSGATCELARRLISLGYPGETPVRIVRENPWVHGPLSSLSGMSLALASRVDFLAETPRTDDNADGAHAAVGPVRARAARSTVRR